MRLNFHSFIGIATAFSVAILVISCSSKLSTIEGQDMSKAPMQTLLDMFAVQSENGNVQMRVEANVMEHYENDTSSIDMFPSGFAVYTYTPEGLLESLVISDKARHVILKKHGEKWEAFGNVVVHNVLKQETVETDTIYWDRKKAEIYTDCYVKMYSKSGFMQGYGMRSDDRARNSILLKPFDSYGVTVKDSTTVEIDSINFIGPFKEYVPDINT